MTIILFENQTADATSSPGESDGFQGSLHIVGSLGGGTITIQVSSDGSSGPFTDILDQTGTPINAFAIIGFYSQFSIPKGYFVQAVLSGSTAPDVTVRLI